MAKKKYKVIERTRRANGAGSIYLQPNGLWTGKIWVTNPETGEKVRKTVYGHSETEVSDKLVKLSGSMTPLNGIFQNKKFGELFEEWLLVFKKAAVSPRTFEANVRLFRLHIKPFVGNMDITEVTSPVIQQVINEVFVSGLGVNTARKTKFLFNQFFEYAVDSGFVENNPTLRIKIRMRDSKEVDKSNLYKAIPEDERIRFVAALNERKDFLKPFCMTMMFAGLRTGEALALRWENIDFENKIISVRYGVTQVPVFDKKGNVLTRKTVIGDTKTACSVRDVPIPDILIEILKDWKKCQWVQKELYGVDLIAPNAIVFCNNDGSVRSYSGTRKIYSNFAKRHGFFKKIHFHTLRHTYSTMLFEANENPKIIQSLLGHKSVKTTLTVYNSVDKSYFKQATDKLNTLFNSEKMKEYHDLKQKNDIPALKRDMSEIEDVNEDPEIAMLEKILAEKKARRKQKDFEM